MATIQELESHILSVCTAMGGIEEYIAEDGPEKGSIKRSYVLGDECLDCLRDLKKFLRLDETDKDRSILRMLGKFEILQRDLIPIVMQHGANVPVSTAVVELLVPMTWPPNQETHDTAGQLEILRSYKHALVMGNGLNAVFQLLIKLLSVPFRQRTDRDNAVIRLIVYFFRNLLCIEDPQPTAYASSEMVMRSKLQEMLLQRLDKLKILEFFVTVGSSIDERQFQTWNTIVLELFYHIFNNIDAKDLFPNSAKKRGEDLAALLQQEQTKKKLQKKAIPTRHSRFGGTIAVKFGDGTRLNLHRQQAAVNPLNQSIDVTKKLYANRQAPQNDDLDVKKRKTVSDDYLRLLKKFGKEFLESCFNPLINSVKRDMDAERTHIREEDYIHILHTIGFFLEFQRYVYSPKDPIMTSSNPDDEKPQYGFELVSSILDVRGMLFIVKRIRMANEEKRWTELHVAVNCFKQLLLSMEKMLSSNNPLSVEVAENIQDNLYYEQSTLELIVTLLKGYKDQSRSYLTALVETTHVLMRLLESYCTSKGTVIIKKKKRGGRKKNDQEETGIIDDVDDEEDTAPQFTEGEFKFERFEMNFANESVIDTYIKLLRDFVSLRENSIHHIVKMFDRVAIKCCMEPLFYKASILNVFNNILQSRRALPSTQEHKELYTFIRTLVSKFFEKAKEYPLLFVEIFFPKHKSDCRRINAGKDALEDDDVFPSLSSNKKYKVWKPEDEIEVKDTLSLSQQIGVTVKVLMDKEEKDLVLWLLEEMQKAADQRVPPERNSDEDDDDDDNGVTWDYYYIQPDDESRAEACKSNKELRLLMRLFRFVPPDTDPDSPLKHWSIPRTRPRDVLLEDINMLTQFVENPLDLDGKPAYKFLKRIKKRKERKRKERVDGVTVSSKRKEKESLKIKSAQFIEDSDDMLSDDDEFWKAEKERRLKTAQKHDALAGGKIDINAEKKGNGHKVSARAKDDDVALSDQDSTAASQSQSQTSTTKISRSSDSEAGSNSNAESSDSDSSSGSSSSSSSDSDGEDLKAYQQKLRQVSGISKSLLLQSKTKSTAASAASSPENSPQAVPIPTAPVDHDTSPQPVLQKPMSKLDQILQRSRNRKLQNRSSVTKSTGDSPVGNSSPPDANDADTESANVAINNGRNNTDYDTTDSLAFREYADTQVLSGASDYMKDTKKSTEGSNNPGEEEEEFQLHLSLDESQSQSQGVSKKRGIIIDSDVDNEDDDESSNDNENSDLSANIRDTAFGGLVGATSFFDETDNMATKSKSSKKRRMVLDDSDSDS